MLPSDVAATGQNMRSAMGEIKTNLFTVVGEMALW